MGLECRESSISGAQVSDSATANSICTLSGFSASTMDVSNSSAWYRQKTAGSVVHNSVAMSAIPIVHHQHADSVLLGDRPRRSVSFVAIDVAWQRPEALGFDPGQLLMGAAQQGSLQVDKLDEMRHTVLAAYLDGLRLEACEADPDSVRFGFEAAMVLRSGFTSLPMVEHFADQQDAGLGAQLPRRAALTRYLVDVGLALPV